MKGFKKNEISELTKLVHGKQPSENQICPVCNSPKNRKETKVLNEQLIQIEDKKLIWYSSLPWHGTIERLFELSHFEWACDNCIDEGNAIKSDVDKQNFCDYPPYLMYYNKIKECEKCESNFTFSKEEQKYWYEELKFWVQSTPRKCKDCYKAIRETNDKNTELSMLLKYGSENLNSKNLYRIAEIYKEMGKEERMKMYLTKAKNQMHKETRKF